MIIIPCTSDQRPDPQVEWQHEWEQHVRQLLREAKREQTFAPHFGYFDFYYSKYNDKRCQIAQVWHRTWVIHVQCAWHGAEENYSKHPTPRDHLHIALDVERPQTIRASIAKPAIKALQEAVCEALAPSLGDASATSPERCLRTDSLGHHIVWENIPFAPDSSDSIVQAARIVAVYAQELLPVAEAAAIRVSTDQGFVLETCPV